MRRQFGNHALGHGVAEVGDPLLSKRRAIIELVAQAERLEVVRASARRFYRASLELEASARRNWADDEIERAKQRTAKHSPCGCSSVAGFALLDIRTSTRWPPTLNHGLDRINAFIKLVKG